MIDCDVHNDISSLKDLLPYMDRAFHRYLTTGGYGGLQMETYPWIHPQGFYRRDLSEDDTVAPGTQYEIVRDRLLDPYDIEYAILTGETAHLASCLPHAQVAAAIASAHNRLVVDEWLARDARLRGSLMVATQDPGVAAAEIRRAGHHPGMVQVVLPGGAPSGYGDPRYWPIYEAAVEMGLPIAVHVGNEGLGINPPPTATGYPSYYFEWHTLLCTAAMSHIVSLIAHGVFERYRDLHFLFIEAGSAWLPTLAWRMDADWRSLREEVPWTRRSPSDILREHIRFTTQPLEQPPNGRRLHEVFDSFDGMADMLLFATDYPHWDFDDPKQALRRLPPAWREKVQSENARAFYGLPVRETLTAASA